MWCTLYYSEKDLNTPNENISKNKGYFYKENQIYFHKKETQR